VIRAVDYHDSAALSVAHERAGGEFDAVSDFVGGECLAHSLPWMREGARAATIVALKGDSIAATAPCSTNYAK
jgi:NADPH:quinone reductase-like Zn-dependent oxidoreductase